jgi:hypothetical protein
LTKNRCLFLLGCAVLAAQAVAQQQPVLPGKPCSDAWSSAVESIVATGDGSGHGPDIGSDEWKSVVEFRLGLRGKAGVPARDSAAWCTYVDLVVRGIKVLGTEGTSQNGRP